MSHQFEEGMTSMEEGVERWSFVVVTGKTGDDDLDSVASRNIQQDWALSSFAENVYILLEQFTSGGQGRAHEKPNWYRQDAVLKRVTRFLLGALRESISSMKYGSEEFLQTGTLYQLRTATTWHAHVLAGSIKNGVFDANM